MKKKKENYEEHIKHCSMCQAIKSWENDTHAGSPTVVTSIKPHNTGISKGNLHEILKKWTGEEIVNKFFGVSSDLRVLMPSLVWSQNKDKLFIEAEEYDKLKFVLDIEKNWSDMLREQFSELKARPYINIKENFYCSNCGKVLIDNPNKKEDDDIICPVCFEEEKQQGINLSKALGEKIKEIRELKTDYLQNIQYIINNINSKKLLRREIVYELCKLRDKLSLSEPKVKE